MKDQFRTYKVWPHSPNITLNKNTVATVRGPLGHVPAAVEVQMITGSIHVIAADFEDIEGWLAQ